MTQKIRKRKIIFHVGTTKTGTTALQVAFSKYSENMLRVGISYPNLIGSGFGWTIDRGMSTGNADIFARYDWKIESIFERFEFLIDKAIAETDPGSDILLSSEHLSVLIPEEKFWAIISRLCTLHNLEPIVSIYLRNPMDMFITCYQQYVKENGFSGELGDYIDVFLNSKHPVSFYAQRTILEANEHAQRNEVPLNILRYESSQNDIVVDFFENVLNLNCAELGIDSSAINIGITRSEIEFHRGVNFAAPKIGQLLGFERSDTFLSKNVKKFKFENDSYFLSLSDQKKLVEAFDAYRKKLSRVVNFADKVDYSVSQKNITSTKFETQSLRHSQLFELGRFFGSSCVNGYINWEWQNDSK